MKITEEAKVTAILNGRQAEDQIEKLTGAANGWKKAMADALAAGDIKKYKQAERGLNDVKRNLRAARKEAFDLTYVLNDLSGQSLPTLV